MKTVLIYSGGMDSTVLLYHLLAEGHEVKCLSVNYGQRHAKELEAATRICRRLNIEHEIADLSGIKPLLAGSSQTDASVAVPHGHFAAESMKLTVVPNRNMMMLAVAIAWAVSLKFEIVAFGAHAGDHTIYPDCRYEFVQAMVKAAMLADWHGVLVLAPFMGMNKGDIAKRGVELGVPFDETWSCYEGQDVPCGKCGACVERAEAMEAAHV